MQIGVTLVKSVAFRDATQEFGNTYHYNFSGESIINEAQGLSIIDRLAVIEKDLHSTLVTFVRALLWSSGGTKAQNALIAAKALSGQGSSTADTTMDKERAFLIQWDAGLDSRNHPVKLKKWFHTCGSYSNVSGGVGSTIQANATGFSTATRNAINAKANDFNPLVVPTVSGDGILIAATGRVGSAGAHSHKYLEHHQLGDQWR